MQIALVDGFRRPPSPKAVGTCQNCGGKMIAKCGSKNIWHWAHKPARNCDPWWENETDWHRAWKSHFPQDWRETIHINPVTGERHIADVKTDHGSVIEFQNSPMPSHELSAREDFYGDMIWIVNGKSFENNFVVMDALPDPNAEFARDLVFFTQSLKTPTFCFWRISENPQYKIGDLVQIHFVETEVETRRLINEHYQGHHMYDWQRPRTVWIEATKPVFIDFGENHLFLLMDYKSYPGRALRCIQKVSKREVIESNGGAYAAE